METQAENVDTQRAEKIAASLEAKPDPKKDEKEKKAKKRKEKEPSKEDIQAAVAGVVLAEMKFWPEQIVALIGEQHPNKESFLKGVAYVIGGYMHFARKALGHLVEHRKKSAEKKTCELLSPVTVELEQIRKEFREQQSADVAKLREERDEELKAAAAAINEKFEKLISEVNAREISDRGKELIARDAEVKDAFTSACATIDKEAKVLSDQITEIEEASENWNSKKRRARRLANGSKDGAEAEEQVE